MFNSNQLTFDQILVKKDYYEPSLHMPFHTDANSRISITLGGSAYEKLNDREQILDTSALVIKPNHTLHETTFSKKGCTILSIQFLDNDLFTSITNEWEYYKHPSLTLLGLKVWTKLKNARNDTDVFNELNQLVSVKKGLSKLQDDAAILNAEQFLFQDMTKKSVQQVSTELQFHRVYLSRLFKKQYQIAPTGFVKNHRLVRAIESLMQKEKSLSETAYQVGFSDQSHMNRSIKKEFGYTPKELKDFFGEVTNVQYPHSFNP